MALSRGRPPAYTPRRIRAPAPPAFVGWRTTGGLRPVSASTSLAIQSAASSSLSVACSSTPTATRAPAGSASVRGGPSTRYSWGSGMTSARSATPSAPAHKPAASTTAAMATQKRPGMGVESAIPSRKLKGIALLRSRVGQPYHGASTCPSRGDHGRPCHKGRRNGRRPRHHKGACLPAPTLSTGGRPALSTRRAGLGCRKPSGSRRRRRPCPLACRATDDAPARRPG